LNGLDLRLFFGELFSTRIGGFFGFDVIMSALVLFTFAVFESMRLGMERRWAVLLGVFIATFLAGVSSGFPLFLFIRQKKLDTL
jgi:hypothetical protein